MGVGQSKSREARRKFCDKDTLWAREQPNLKAFTEQPLCTVTVQGARCGGESPDALITLQTLSYTLYFELHNNVGRQIIPKLSCFTLEDNGFTKFT